MWAKEIKELCQASSGSINRKLLQCFGFASNKFASKSNFCDSCYESQSCWATQWIPYTDRYLLRLVKTRKIISHSYRALHWFTLWFSTSVSTFYYWISNLKSLVSHLDFSPWLCFFQDKLQYLYNILCDSHACVCKEANMYRLVSVWKEMSLILEQWFPIGGPEFKAESHSMCY